MTRIPIDEWACIEVIEHVLVRHDGFGLKGRTLLDLGCGRGVCLREARLRGAATLIGVDLEEAACGLTEREVPGCRTVVADGSSVPLPDGSADVVWSHGVVEHMDEDAVRQYLKEAVRLSRQWVAFGAPNPLNGPYREFKRRELKAERWRFGYEEPLGEAYGWMLLDLGCQTVWDGEVGIHDSDLALLYAQQLPSSRKEFWRKLWLKDPQRVGGVAHLVVAKV